MFADIGAARLHAFHDAALSQQDKVRVETSTDSDIWHWIATNHRCNALLWTEEDEARRHDVPDAAIVANKRAIDRYNQQRNDAVERIDDLLLSRLADVTPRPDAQPNSETAGAMVDRMSILALKSASMRRESERGDASADHRTRCAAKFVILATQRRDLGVYFDTLLAQAADGRAYWRLYRQFKMYNDPALNPALYRTQS